MVEGKKNLPGETESRKYPIDIEKSMAVAYREFEDEMSINIYLSVCELINIAYTLGKSDECIPRDMIALIQDIATEAGSYELSFGLMCRVSEAHAQGRKDGEGLEGGAGHGKKAD